MQLYYAEEDEQPGCRPVHPSLNPRSALATGLQLSGILATIGQDDQLVNEECRTR